MRGILIVERLETESTLGVRVMRLESALGKVEEVVSETGFVFNVGEVQGMEKKLVVWDKVGSA